MSEQKEILIGDVFAIKLEKYNLYYLCQIVNRDESNDKIAVLLIDYFSEVLPTIEAVKQMQPLKIDHHFWKGDLQLFWTETFDTKHLIYIGNTTPIYIEDEIEDDDNISDQYQPMLQYLWQQLPQETRTNFKNNIKGTQNKVIIEEKKDTNFWSSLNELPCLYEIFCSVWNEELMNYLETNPLIITLELKNTQKQTIDISRTSIQDLTLDVTGVEVIKLNKHIVKLKLNGDFSHLKIIEDPFKGKYVCIDLWNFNIFPNVEGIESLNKLDIVSKTVNILDITKQFKRLEVLKIWGENGFITNLLELRQLENLRTLWLMNIFGFNDLPKLTDLPNLKVLRLHNIPKLAGQQAKKEFQSIEDLYVVKLRSDEWIKLNLENPFGSWDGRDGTSVATAKKAMKIYNDIYKRLKETSLTKDEEAKTLQDFIESFNQIDKKHFIDTLERDEIWDAYNILSKMTTLTAKEAEDIFENVREF
jgi:hypothetical protein